MHNNVELAIADESKILDLTWIDEEEQLILCERLLPTPIREVRMTVHGSSDNVNEYGFIIDVELLDTDDNDDRVQNMLAAVARETNGVQTEEEKLAYVIQSPGTENFYRLSYDPFMCQLSLETVGGKELAGKPADVIIEYGLRHILDDEQASLEEFLLVSEALIQQLYSAYGRNNVSFEAIVAPVDELELENARSQEDYEQPKELLAAPIELQPEGVRLDDLAGIDNIVEELKDTVLALQHPEVLAAWGEQRLGGIFLYGPPGTGKTTLATALANEIEAEFRLVSPNDIYEKWIGNSEHNLKQIFDEAAEARGPYVLLFDELDGLIQEGGSVSHAGVAAIFKQRLTTFAQDNPNVVIIATSNKAPDEISPALIRAGRFDTKICVPLPDTNARRDIFGALTAQHALRLDVSAQRVGFASDIDYQKLALATENFSGADIDAVLAHVLKDLRKEELKTGVIPKPSDMEALLRKIAHYKRENKIDS